VGEHLTNTYNSSLGGGHTHDLGCSLGCPLTEKHDTIEIVQGHSEQSCEESRRKTIRKLFLFHCCFVCADDFDYIALL